MKPRIPTGAYGVDLPHNRPQSDFSYWTRLPVWTLTEAIALLCGKIPEAIEALEEKGFSLPDDCARVKRLALRTIGDERRPWPEWLAWAKAYNLLTPSELEAEADKRAGASGPALSLEPATKGLSPPPLHKKIIEVMNRLWPDGVLPARAKERNNAILAEFAKQNQTRPSEATIRRALARWKPSPG
jgi:hypothetical protein